METKEFDQLSNEHSGVKTGTRFKSIKFHHEVQGDLEEGTELVLDSIAHYPTRYLFKDENGKIWTLPIHSVKEATEMDTKEEDSLKEVQEKSVLEEVENNKSEVVSADEKNNK